MNCFKAKVMSNKKVAPDHFKLAFKAPKIAEKVKPGQFFNIRVSDSYEPLLRRPFGAHKIGKDYIEILYKVVGKATTLLSKKKKGDTLGILGPLGNGFTVSADAADTVILVAGGHGVAPLYALAKRVKGQGSRVKVFIGARTKKHVVCESDFRKLGAEVHIATDDGSKGHKGLITEILCRHCESRPKVGTKQSQIRNRPRTASVRKAVIYACGSKPMLKAVAKIAKRKNTPCQLSLEEYMACGIGTCLGCAVKTKNGYKIVCKDGPVFDAREIVWD